MREADIAVLAEPLADDEYAGDATELIFGRLGRPADLLPQLRDELLGDLSDESLGFGWWDEHLDTRARVLISDYLIGLVSEVPDALLHAWIHLSSWRGLRESEDSSRTWRLGASRMLPTPPSSLAETLPTVQHEMHLAGFFRSVGTALDLLAGLIVGVGGLSTSLRRAGWASTQRQLEKERNRPVAERLELEKIVARSGPEDWDAWAVDMRNSIVHRPRRMTWIHLRTPLQPGPRSTFYLTGSPGLSDLEDMRLHRSPEGALLHEDADQTLAGIYTSLWSVVELLVPRLIRLWDDRRSGIFELTQPSGQWDEELPEVPSFRGYAKTSKPMQQDVREVVMNPTQGRRFRAAGLMDDQRHRWAL